jgi:hypothetical protein
MNISLKGALAGNQATEAVGKDTIANFNTIYPTTQGGKRVNFGSFPGNEGSMIVMVRVVGNGRHGSHLECSRVGGAKKTHPTDLT